MIDLHQYLVEHGGCLSSELKKLFLKEGKNDIAARKAISRFVNSNDDICKLDSNIFPNRESYIYFKPFKESKEFLSCLLETFQKSASPHFYCIKTMLCFGSKIHKQKLPIITSCPDYGNKRKSSTALISELNEMGFIIDNEDDYFTINPLLLTPQEQAEGDQISIAMDFESEILVCIIKEWLKKNNFVSFRAESRSKPFAHYYFDFFAPSYLLPFLDIKDRKTLSGFVVFDVLPKDNITLDELMYFIKKIRNCNSNPKQRPFLPIFIGYSYAHEAFVEGKKNHIVLTTPNLFFGTSTNDLLDSIHKLLMNINLVDIHENEIKSIIDGISKIAGDSNNIVGHLFEFITADVVRRTQGASFIQHNKKIQTNDRRCAEIDIFALNDSEVHIYEAKGYSSYISKNMLKEWVEKKIPKIKTWIKETPEYANRRIKFHFWTTSDYDIDAKKYFNDQKNIIKKYDISIKNGKDIYTFCREKHLTDLCDVLREHYSVN